MNSEWHVVLGGSGGIGHAVATRLAEGGKAVRAVNRRGRIDDLPDEVEVRAADALDPAGIAAVCAGAAVVYHCVHPRENYDELAPMTENIIAAAEATGARLVMAASVYPYGKVDGPLTEALPHKPEAPSGAAHAQAAERVMAAHAAGRVAGTIGRASNTFGPHACRLWPGIDFRQALAGEKMQIIGKTGPLHTYTYVFDFADGLITLGERVEAPGEIWHIPSAPTISTGDFLDLMYAEIGRPPNVQVGPRPILTVMSWFNPQLTLALEVFYQFDRPFVVDHGKFERAFGARPTPHREAIRATVAWLRSEGQAMPRRPSAPRARSTPSRG